MEPHEAKVLLDVFNIYIPGGFAAYTVGKVIYHTRNVLDYVRDSERGLINEFSFSKALNYHQRAFSPSGNIEDKL